MNSVNVKCRSIILKKLSGAVVYCIVAQIVTLFVFLFVTNINILHPLESFKNILQSVSSISTWLYVIPLSSIIFAQSVVCAKDYVTKPVYNVSKFRKFILYFSFHNIALLLLYIMAGFLNIWLYLSLSGGTSGILYVINERNYFCLAEENLFMILSGFWIGFTFFITYCTREKFIEFPVLQQKKLVQFKTNFFTLFEESRKMATGSVMSYFFFCLFCRPLINQIISNILNVIYEPTRLSITSYIYVWLFAIAYFFLMNLMSLFFKLFLTEAIHFPLDESSETYVSLSVAIECNSTPIIQHLACLDLYLLSIWSISRRNVLFSLSQPGEHPHHWNKVFASSLKVISQFTKTLNNSLNLLLEQPKKKEDVEKKKTPVNVLPEKQIEQNRIVISPFKGTSLANVINPFVNVSGHKQFLNQAYSSNPKYKNIRNMTLINTGPPTETVQSTYPFPKLILKEMKLYEEMKEKLSDFITNLKKLFAFDYLFGEVIEANIHGLLRNGQPIVWLTQGLSHLAVSAYSEDSYGVVQKDLHILIITLLELREAIEKLNRLLMLNKRGRSFEEHSYKMKHNINVAAKRCLYDICLTYKDCINDLPLNNEALLQLQHYRQTDESCRTVPGYYKNPDHEGFM